MNKEIKTASYWEARYAGGGNSGAGSYSHLALYKARFLNRFVANARIHSVGELGCGDGAQLDRALYPRYIGYDVAQSAVARCSEKFKDDATKSFFWLSELKSLSEVELGLSLDVVYHLIEDEVYEEHLRQLFRMSSRFAIIYGNEVVKPYPVAHVKLRNFRTWIDQHCSGWRLIDVEKNPFYSEVGNDRARTWSNFYVYEAPTRSLHPVLTPGPDYASLSPTGPGPRLHMSGDAFRQTTTAGWREIVRNAEHGTIVVVPRAEVGPDIAAQPAVTSGYVREIVREVRDDHAGAEAEPWMGSLCVEPDLIVSLTTIRSRIDRLDTVIGSFLDQSRKPTRIVLNISSEPYLLDEGISRDDLSPFVKKLEKAGLLEIKTVPNTGPYRKLLPTLRSEWESNSVIVTADDDTVYPAFWLDELYKAYLTHRAVIAPRCRYMKTTGGIPHPYNEWGRGTGGRDEPVKPEHKGIFAFATGRDGVLYHPEFFTEDVFDAQLIELAPTTDDVVFKLATMMTATPVRTIQSKLSSTGIFEDNQYPAAGPSTSSLWEQNKKGGNDESMTKLIAYFRDKKGLRLEKFVQDAPRR